MSDRTLRLLWGRRLQEARRTAGISQAELARRVDTFQEQISRWENGVYAPVDAMRPRLAKALGTTVADLFPYPDDTNGGAEAA